MKFTLTAHQLSRLLFNIRSGDWSAKIETTEDAELIMVKIFKFGTSILEFSKKRLLGDLFDIELVKEDIAWLHRKYIPDIKLKIEQLVNEVKGVSNGY